jgi:DNA (cytosine-5)-methyltransferase 1
MIETELVVDNFAGGGGASTGIEQALNRPVDIAINHDPVAVELHRANHPRTRHCCEDVFKVDPVAITRGRRVGFAWFSPDCKHFSKAKGGKPRSKKIRGLAWVVIKWAEAWPIGQRPRCIVLENVEEFQDWGPLLPNGHPCPKRKGQTFKSFVKRLMGLGYQVEWRELRACDYGAPTIRKRLFLIARCDGKPIVWPKPTHADPNSKGFAASGLKPWPMFAGCIDWSLACPSIFLSKDEGRKIGVKRPLAEATLRRIARGIRKFVIEAKEPFIVQYHSAKRPGDHRVSSVSGPLPTQTTEPRFGLVAPFVTEHANASTQRNFDPKQPLRTQCAEVKGGHFALVAAFLAKHYGGVVGTSPKRPIGTITSVDHHSLVAAHLAKFRFDSEGASLRKPSPTITAGSFIKRPAGAGHALALVASHLTKFYGTNTGQKTNEPLHSVTAQGNHLGEVRAFLIKYYSEGGQDQALTDPLHTVPTKDRFSLITINGEPWAICDIGMRMLVPRELYRAQGFPESYKIQIPVRVIRRGKILRIPLSLEAQVRMCGNSVCPPVAEAITAANVPELRAA